MFDAHVGDEELPVKGGVVPLSFRQLVAKKTERLPGGTYLLLEYAAYVGVGGIGGEGEDRPW